MIQSGFSSFRPCSLSTTASDGAGDGAGDSIDSIKESGCDDKACDARI
jgi:hypothetical protein